MRKYLLFILLLLVVTTTFGCSKNKGEQYVETVKKYNKLLVMALKSSDGEILSGITSDREEGRITIFISSLDNKNEYMDAQLSSFKVLESKEMTDQEKQAEINSNPFGEREGVKNKNPMAIVKTDEVWGYTNYDKKSRKAVTKLSRTHYRMSYILEYKDKKWEIRNVKFDQEEILK